MNRTRLSSKGQLVLPKSVRDRQGWMAGTELEVEDRGDAVVLRRVRPTFPRTTIEKVRGSAGYRGPTVPVEDFDQGIAEQVREAWEDFERQPD